MVSAAALPLLSIALNHDYYAGPFAAFGLRALPATEQLCRDLGLRLVQHGAQLTLALLANSTSRLSAPAYRAKLAASDLCWEIAPTDNRFAAFTGVDFAGPDHALILSAVRPGPHGGLLTAGETASTNDVWPRQALRHDYAPAQPLRIGTALELQTVSGQALRSLKVTDPHLVPLNVSDFGSGLYQLAHGRTVLTRWFADERLPLGNSTDPVLVLSGALLGSLAPTRANVRVPATPPAFTATLPARPVVWRYHVFNSPVGGALTITTESASGAPARGSRMSSAPSFRPLPVPVLPGARSFESVRPLPLTAEPTQLFALQRDGAPLCSPLPAAGFDFARPPSGEAIRSDIFVYL